MKVRDYIDSGILEVYVLGLATEEEIEEFLALKKAYPEVEEALYELEKDVEAIAKSTAIPPPPVLWERIEDNINTVSKREKILPLKIEPKQGNRKQGQKSTQFIEVEGTSSHMRIHKLWRWVFAGVFILGKIFLAFAIYYYLENRQLKEMVGQQKLELMKHK